MTHLELPLEVPQVRELHVGDQVELTGPLFTVRHGLLEAMKSGAALPLEPGSVVYHCGPVGKKSGKKWTVTGFAPDHTSAVEPYVRELLVRYSVRGIIGRGELGPKTIEACRQSGTCYFQTIGGAGPLLADRITEVKQIHLADKFDQRDAMWEVHVEKFPAIVMIDMHGQSLHDIVRDVSQRRLINLP